MVNCPYCNAQLRQANMKRHLNMIHLGRMAQADINHLGFVLHEVCGMVYTQQGMHRHCRRCVAVDGNGAWDGDGHGDGNGNGNGNGVQHDQQVAPEILLDPPDNPRVPALQPDTPQVDYPGWGQREVSRIGGAPASYVNLGQYHAPRYEALSTAHRVILAEEVQRIAALYVGTPSEDLLLRMLSMPIVGARASGVADTRRHMAALRRTAADQLLDGMDVPQRGPAPTPTLANEELTVRECTTIGKHLRAGHVRKAASIVRGQAGVAHPTPAVMEQMRAKHPQGERNPFGEGDGPACTRLPLDSIQLLDSLVKKLDVQTSPGISGWSPHLVQLCYGRPEEDRPFRRFLFTLAVQMNAGTAPGKEMLCASRLTPLQVDPAPKCRPVACGELFYRILMRFLMRQLGCDGMLAPQQFGVGSPGGVEPIVELVNLELQGLQDLQDRHVYSLDMSNAFNTVKRTSLATALRTGGRTSQRYYRLAKWAYNDRTPLIMRRGQELEIIYSAEGVRQGDPLGPLLFSLCLRSKLKSLKDIVAPDPRDHVSAYLDDVYLVSDSADKLQAILEEFNKPDRDGLVMNADKTTKTSLAAVIDGDEHLSILGSMVGSVQARRTFLVNKINDLRPTLARMRPLPYQQAFSLLRLCFAPQLMHLLRTMDLSDLDDELKELDEMLWGQLDLLRCASPTLPADEKAKRVYSLPTSMGGCGILSYQEIRPFARRASQRASHEVLRHMGANTLLHDDGEANMDANTVAGIAENANANANANVEEPRHQRQLVKRHFIDHAVPEFLQSLQEEERIAFLDNASKCGTAWIFAQPWSNGHRSLGDRAIASALNIRTLQSDVLRRNHCPNCQEAATVLHFESCPQAQNPVTRQARHDCIRDVLIRAIKTQHPHRAVRPEPFINNNNNNRRADISVSAAGGVHGLDARYGLMDLTITIPLTRDAADARARALLPPPPGEEDVAGAVAARAQGEEAARDVHAQAQAQAQPHADDDANAAAAYVGVEEGHPDPRRPVWKQIEATLEVAARHKRNHYAQLQPTQMVLPIVITSGGTLHKDAHQLLKDLFPTPESRTQVCIDISLALVRGRAAAYSLEPRG